MKDLEGMPLSYEDEGPGGDATVREGPGGDDRHQRRACGHTKDTERPEIE